MHGHLVGRLVLGRLGWLLLVGPRGLGLLPQGLQLPAGVLLGQLLLLVVLVLMMQVLLQLVLPPQAPHLLHLHEGAF